MIYNVMDRRFGAKGDGVADDSDAIASCVAAAPAGSTILFPAGHAFVWDREIYARQPGVTFRGTGARIRTPNRSKLFAETENPYTRFQLRLCNDDQTVVGLTFEGNSENNSYDATVTLTRDVEPSDTQLAVAPLAAAIPPEFDLAFTDGGVAKGVVTAAAAQIGATTITVDAASQRIASGTSANVAYYVGNRRGYGNVLVGFYGKDLSGQKDLRGITIRACTFDDSPQLGIDCFQQGSVHRIHGLHVVENHFRRCQGGQCTFSFVTEGVCRDNLFDTPLFCAFQFYYANTDCQFVRNTIQSSVAALDLAKLDPTLYTGKLLNFSDRLIFMGKLDASPNVACAATDNRLFGGGIMLTQGAQNCRIESNSIYASESTGICVIAENADFGNVVRGNTIVDCDQPGLYLDVASHPVTVEGNHLYGNCRRALSPTFGGRELDAQIYVWSSNYTLRRNKVRAGASSVKYGVLTHTAAVRPELVDNDFRGAGTMQDVAVNTGLYPPVIRRAP